MKRRRAQGTFFRLAGSEKACGKNGSGARNQERQGMLKTFKDRRSPTTRQARLLSEQLEELRWLGNTLLTERKIAWEERQEAVSYDDQQSALPTMKTTLRPPRAQVHSCGLVIDRDLNAAHNILALGRQCLASA
jgi:transposase